MEKLHLQMAALNQEAKKSMDVDLGGSISSISHDATGQVPQPEQWNEPVALSEAIGGLRGWAFSIAERQPKSDFDRKWPQSRTITHLHSSTLLWWPSPSNNGFEIQQEQHQLEPPVSQGEPKSFVSHGCLLLPVFFAAWMYYTKKVVRKISGYLRDCPEPHRHYPYQQQQQQDTSDVSVDFAPSRFDSEGYFHW